MNFVKKTGKKLLCVIFEKQVKALRRKHKFKIVAVVGSVGKTSTKLSVASVLARSYTVRHQEGNYNDRLTVPLVIFGHNNPGLFNILAWIKIFVSNQRQIMKKFPYEVVVLELGTDAPGQIAEFAYLKPELAVVTAATPEHMEFFGTVEAVAKEELGVAEYSEITLINADDVDKGYYSKLAGRKTYGTKGSPDYEISTAKTVQGIPQKAKIKFSDSSSIDAEINLLGSQGAKVALAAFAVACELGMDPREAAEALSGLQAFGGRMRLIAGINGSTIIDDTYNSSPAAVFAALDVLYSFDAPQRIAILGTMNELGETSKDAHIEMGEYCDPSKLDLVITIGKEAEKYTAPAAKKKGCKVASFDSPYKAGNYAKSELKDGAVVLAKGSQNRVFAEEALKPLLAENSDMQKLVRQSSYWLKVKHQQFPEGEQ